MKKFFVTIVTLAIAPICFAIEQTETIGDSAGKIDWPDIPLPNSVDVETDLLGWINVSSYPFIFSYSLSSWMYIPYDLENIENGTWLYIYK